MRPALVLLDRDGVINHDLAESVRHVSQFALIQGSADAIARLNRARIKVAVVTNQSVVGRGHINAEQLNEIHAHMHYALAQHGAKVDALFCCTDDPTYPTPNRKPAPGMLLCAMHDFDVPPDHTVMIGDAITDMQAAKAAHCARVLVRTGKGSKTEHLAEFQDMQPVMIAEDLSAAVDALLEQGSGQ